MEKVGIGRPATTANMIDKILNREYLCAILAGVVAIAAEDIASS